MNGSDTSPCWTLPNGKEIIIIIVMAYTYIHIYMHTAADGCSFEKDAIYGITWPSTAINVNATNNCPSGIGMLLSD